MIYIPPKVSIKTLPYLLLFTLLSPLVHAETLSFTTYYPAPFGAYDTLRLIPRATPPTCNSTVAGGLYMDNNSILQICRDPGTGFAWLPLSTAWTQNGDNIYPTDTATRPNILVGIGMTTPPSRLSVQGDGTGIVQIGKAGCAGNYAGMTLGRTTAPTACNEYNILSSPTDKNLYLNRPSGLEMHFRENNATQMVMRAGGNVGIGNSTPGYKLHVGGDIYANGGWLRVSGAQGLYFESYGGGWNMIDSTWIRSYGAKPVFMSNGFDTSSASGVGCGGGLGGGYTFQVCGSALIDIIYDRNNPGYYLDPASTSRMNYTVSDNTFVYGYTYAGILYDSNNPGYYVDPNGTNRLNYVLADRVDAPIFYDSNNTGYYVDPNATSVLHYAYFTNQDVGGFLSIGGPITVSGYMTAVNAGFSGNVVVAGTLSASSKSFVIDHPAKPGYQLVHSTLEGPEIAVFYRGTERLLNGKAKITLPDYFDALTRDGEATVLLTARGDEPFLLSYNDFNEKSFVVHGSKPDGEFDWELKSVRGDLPPLEVERKKD